MSQYLKAQTVFDFMHPNAYEIGFRLLDVRKIYKCFKEGDYISSRNSMRLLESDYDCKNYYMKIPRTLRLNVSEGRFLEKNFSYESFYDYKTPEEDILFDYYTEFLKLFPTHKKTKSLFKEFKTKYPELFI